MSSYYCVHLDGEAAKLARYILANYGPVPAIQAVAHVTDWHWRLDGTTDGGVRPGSPPPWHECGTPREALIDGDKFMICADRDYVTVVHVLTHTTHVSVHRDGKDPWDVSGAVEAQMTSSLCVRAGLSWEDASRVLRAPEGEGTRIDDTVYQVTREPLP
ncbi:MAG: hypothetical protein FWD75_06620 [Propionibacteriaceae bacterium]|nr:hypothetical protein [Propionibacteriaceae bacterium]